MAHARPSSGRQVDEASRERLVGVAPSLLVVLDEASQRVHGPTLHMLHCDTFIPIRAAFLAYISRRFLIAQHSCTAAPQATQWQEVA